MAKYDLLLLEVNKLKPTFVVLTETHLKPQISDSLISIQGYSLFRCDRDKGEGWGGVAMYVADQHQGTTIQATLNTTYNNKPDVEALWLDIRYGDFTLLIAGVYRPTHYTLEATDITLFDTIEKASQGNECVLVMGDFNLPEIKWPLQNFSRYKKPLYERFIETYTDSNLHQIVLETTRKRKHEESLLDLILCSDENLCTSLEYCPPIGKSDHVVLIMTIQFQSKKANVISDSLPRRNFFHADYDKISNKLHEQLTQSTCGDSIHTSWEQFKNITHNIIVSHVPLKLKHGTGMRNKPWIGPDIIKMTKEKAKLWKLYRLDRTSESYQKYRYINNKIIAKTRKARRLFEKKIADSGSKAFHGYIRNQLSSGVSLPSLRDTTGNIINEHKVVADILANQFVKAYVREPDGPVPVVAMERVENSINDVKFTPEDIYKALNGLDTTSSMGPDEIPAMLLKGCARTICHQLAEIMTMSFQTGELPQEWKCANVTPIYKKGDKLSATNYRPISLTCIICKIMEKVIVAEIRKFLLTNNIIVDEQHAFYPGRSTITNLLCCVDSWTEAWDKRNPEDIIYLDYEKAYDRIAFRRLIVKLEHFGIRGKLLKWIESFLTNRTFRVRIGEALSDCQPVLSGVPQGSVIAPLLFGIFLTDLAPLVKAELSIFADDTKIMGNPIVDHGTIQEDLNRVVSWTKDWLLTLNADKCTVLHMGKSNPKIKYTIDGTVVAAVTTQKDLGINVSCDLKWETHIMDITKRANSLLYLIKKTFSFMDRKLFLQLYKTYVRPLLEYGFQVWSPYFKKDIAALERVQRRATKMVYACRNKTYEERLRELGLTTLEERRSRGDLIETYKILTGHYDVPRLNSLFILSNNTNLRGHSLKLCINRCASNPRTHFLPNRVAGTWNKLPQDVVGAPSVNSFKNRLDKFNKK